MFRKLKAISQVTFQNFGSHPYLVSRHERQHFPLKKGAIQQSANPGWRYLGLTELGDLLLGQYTANRRHANIALFLRKRNKVSGLNNL